MAQHDQANLILTEPKTAAGRRRIELSQVAITALREQQRRLLAKGLRASLLEGVHAKVVQERLGHSKIALTLDTYSHVLPSMQRDAADRLDHMFLASDSAS